MKQENIYLAALKLSLVFLFSIAFTTTSMAQVDESLSLTEENSDIEELMVDKDYFSALNQVILGTEEIIKIEAWMISDNYWKKDYSLFSDLRVDDDELELEAWMLSPFYFFPDYSMQMDLNYQEEKDKVEAWMFSSNYWCIDYNPCSYGLNEDGEQELEAWMIDQEFWNSKCILTILLQEIQDDDLQVEKWMVDKEYFSVQ